MPAVRAAGEVIPAGSLSRILVIRPGGLGDAVLLRPALAALAATCPEARIDVLAERRNAGAFEIGTPGYTVIHYDRGPAAALAALVRAHYDLVIDTEQYHCLPALLARALRPRWHCGFATLDRARLRTHPVPYAPGRYEAEAFLDLVTAVTGRTFAFDANAPFLAVDAPTAERAATRLAPLGDRPFAAVLPASGGLFRSWPAERFTAVAKHLQSRGLALVLLGGPDARAIAGDIARSLPARHCLDLSGATTLAETAAVLERARLAVALDSGPLHLAFAVGTPTVSLFGPALWRKWAPPGARHRTVRLGLDCSPCTVDGRVPPCPYDVACMRDLGTERVTAAIDSLLAA